MTVIECFERDPIDNIATCLSLRPDTLIFIGEQGELQESVSRYRQFLKRRKLPTNILLRNVKRDDITEVIALLDDIVTAGDECVIDLAGGNEIVLAAAGAVYERRRDDYPVTLQRIDAPTGCVEDCDGDGVTEKLSSPKITVRELIALYGGSAAPDKRQPDADCMPQDINPLWNAVIRDAGLWNRRVSVLNEFESRAGATAQNLSVTINFGLVRGTVANYPEKRALFMRLIDDLEACGVIRISSRAEGAFRYRYNTPLLRYCLRKSGNALEHKVLLEARALRQNGRPVFNDCLMGVTIDWDGVVHRPVSGGIKDTKNEIDVVLTHGLIPVFVSCKNGGIEDAELYKLNTVAERFGGERAKKVLIATDFCPDSEDAKLSLLQRAADMGIYFEPDAASLTDAGWQELFLRAIGEE